MRYPERLNIPRRPRPFIETVLVSPWFPVGGLMVLMGLALYYVGRQ